MTQQPRALLVAHQYWPTPGAATTRLSATVRELRVSGFEVDVATCAPPAGFEPLTTGPAGEKVHFVAAAEGGGRGGLGRVAALASFARGVRRLGRTLDFDVVISDPPPTAGHAASTLARRRGVPFVYYMADSWAGASRDAGGLAGAAHPSIAALENWVLRRASVVLAATPGMAEIARGSGQTAVEVVLNGVPIDVFQPDGPVWNPTGGERPYFLYAGNAGVVHGAFVFADAAADLWQEGHDFDLVYMGYGSGLPQVAEVAARFPGRLHLVESQPLERVAAAFRGCVAGLTSLRPNDLYADARPIKAMTSLACGAPPVYIGDGAFADELRAANLGYVESWGTVGARDAMRRALRDARDPETARTSRELCSAYAAEHLSDKASARAAARAVLGWIH